MNPKLKKMVLRELKGTFDCYSFHQSSGRWTDGLKITYILRG